MKPLPWIGMGLVIVIVTARMGDYDVLADPLGWLVVLLGLNALGDPPGRLVVLGLAWAALVVSAVLWWPGSGLWLDGEDPALRWALALPQLGFQSLVCCHLAALAEAADDTSARRWLRTAGVTIAALAVVPLIAIGASSAAVETATIIAAGAASILVVCLLFGYGARPWAVSSG